MNELSRSTALQKTEDKNHRSGVETSQCVSSTLDLWLGNSELQNFRENSDKGNFGSIPTFFLIQLAF